MAVSQVTQVETLTIIKETAADVISIYRRPIQNPETGKVDIVFDVEIKYSTIEYHGTSLTDRTDVVRSTPGGKFTLTPQRVGQLFSMLLTLPGGSQKMLGDLLADEADTDISGNIAALTIMRIVPGISRVSSDTFRIAPIDGCTYVWTVSDPVAHVEIQPNGDAKVVGGTMPMTITCEATETSSGIKAQSSVTLS